MINDWKDLILLVLGWLLGLLAPSIVDEIRNIKESKKIKTALIAELQELRLRLMLNVYTIDSKYGILDHQFFEWAQSILIDYKGVNSDETLMNIIGPLLKLTKDEMTTYSQMAKQQKLPNSAMSLRKYSLPFLDTSIGALAKFDLIFIGKVLDIKTKIGFLNEITDDTRYYFQLSFQNGISSENHTIANTNLISQYKYFASRARDIIKIIGEVT